MKTWTLRTENSEYHRIRNAMSAARTWAELREASRLIFDAQVTETQRDALWNAMTDENVRMAGERGWKVTEVYFRHGRAIA